jgi:hypothetical protein
MRLTAYARLLCLVARAAMKVRTTVRITCQALSAGAAIQTLEHN